MPCADKADKSKVGQPLYIIPLCLALPGQRTTLHGAAKGAKAGQGSGTTRTAARKNTSVPADGPKRKVALRCATDLPSR